MSRFELDAFELSAHLARALDEAGVPYAIGGAIAYGLWGDPRGTHDVDLNLFVQGHEFETALDVLAAAGVELDRATARRADSEGDTIVGWCEGIRVDMFTPSIPFAYEAQATAVRVEGPHGTASYLSAEAIAVFKLMFYRPKDLLDLEKLIAVQGDDLDKAYVLRWVADMMGEDDERVAAWDRLASQ